MNNLSVRDLWVFQEKSRIFCESFQISLNKLEHEDLSDNLRQCDDKNVTRMLNIFCTESCQCWESENHVSVLVSLFTLSQVCCSIFKELQQFVLKASLQVLHERHCLKVRCRFLKETDKWWIINLYSNDEKVLFSIFCSCLLTNSDLSPIVINELWEQDSNFSRWYDKNIVHQIQFLTLTDNSSSSALFSQNVRREKWLVRLFKSKWKCFLQLKTLSEKFLNCLNDLILFADLWLTVQIETFSQLLNLYCSEIWDFFADVFSLSNMIEEDYLLLISSQEDVNSHHWEQRRWLTLI